MQTRHVPRPWYLPDASGSECEPSHHGRSGRALLAGERDPARRVVFLNYSAVLPELTNEKCSYWHFRFDAHLDMRMAALMGVVKDDAALKSVYIIGQDLVLLACFAPSGPPLMLNR